MTEAFPLGASQLYSYRIALASLEAEKVRLVAKYDLRIEALKKGITELERRSEENLRKIPSLILHIG